MATLSSSFQRLRLSMGIWLKSWRGGVASWLPSDGPPGLFSSPACLATTVWTKPLPTSILVLSAMRTTKRSSFTLVIVP